MKNKSRELMSIPLNRYFKAFSNKDIETLKDLVSDDIYLQDWEVEVEGKEDFIKFNQGLFDSVDNISVTGYTFFWGIPVRETEGFEDSLFSFFCPIKVDIGNESIEVMDLITFNEEGKICGIIAYRQ